MNDIPIVDAHHHFWDLSLKKNPWLDPNNQIPFRYGDYGSICKNFLISDYKEVSKKHNIAFKNIVSGKIYENIIYWWNRYY